MNFVVKFFYNYKWVSSVRDIPRRNEMAKKKQTKIKCDQCGKEMTYTTCAECNGKGTQREWLFFKKTCEYCQGAGVLLRCPDERQHILDDFEIDEDELDELQQADFEDEKPVATSKITARNQQVSRLVAEIRENQKRRSQTLTQRLGRAPTGRTIPPVTQKKPTLIPPPWHPSYPNPWHPMHPRNPNNPMNPNSPNHPGNIRNRNHPFNRNPFRK